MVAQSKRRGRITPPGEIIVRAEGLPSDVWQYARKLEAAGFKIVATEDSHPPTAPRLLWRTFTIRLFMRDDG